MKIQVPNNDFDYGDVELMDFAENVYSNEEKKVIDTTDEIFFNYLLEHTLDLEETPDYYSEIIANSVVADLIYDGSDSPEVMDYIHDVSYDLVYERFVTEMEKDLE